MSSKKQAGIVDPKKIYKFLSENEAYGNISQKSYDLNRASATSALKSMIRERYTPEILKETTTVKAMVVDAQDKAAGTIPLPYTDAIFGAKTDGTQLVRVRVLSDTRHFWLPMPLSTSDPFKVFHPLVRHSLEVGGERLQFGDIVDVTFDNTQSQFTSTAEVGLVTNVIGSALGSNFSSDAKDDFQNQDCSITVDQDAATLTLQNCGVYVGNQARIIPFPKHKGDKIDKNGFIRPRVPVEKDVEGAALQKVLSFTNNGGLKTAIYGEERTNEQGKKRIHKGTDFRARLGAPIFATLDGYATTGYADGYGFWVLIQHTDYQAETRVSGQYEDVTIFSLYAHLADHSWVNLVNPGGQFVQRGYPIGISGGSGWGPPHLHFEITYGQAGATTPKAERGQINYQDPVDFLNLRLKVKETAYATGADAVSVAMSRSLVQQEEDRQKIAKNNEKKAKAIKRLTAKYLDLKNKGGANNVVARGSVKRQLEALGVDASQLQYPGVSSGQQGPM